MIHNAKNPFSADLNNTFVTFSGFFLDKSNPFGNYTSIFALLAYTAIDVRV